jgi:hypothetical protein
MELMTNKLNIADGWRAGLFKTFFVSELTSPLFLPRIKSIAAGINPNYE